MLQRIVNKDGVHGRLPVAALLAVMSLMATRVPAIAATSSEDALRARVEQLYDALQQGDYSRVEKFLTKESKQAFRSQPKQPVMAHRIESIKLDPRGETAQVVVMIPSSGSSIPQLTGRPQRTNWKLIKGNWYLEFFRPDPNALQALVGQKPSVPPKLPPLRPTAPPTEIKFESTFAGLDDVHYGEVKVVRFPVTNVSNHEVKLELVKTGCDCIRMKSSQMELKPGESGVLEFEFDPSKLQINAEQAFRTSVELRTQPGGERALLTISALIEPGAAPPPKP